MFSIFNLVSLAMPHCIYCNLEGPNTLCGVCKLDCVKCARCETLVYKTMPTVTGGVCFECFLFPDRCTVCQAKISALVSERYRGICQNCVSKVVPCLLCSKYTEIDRVICRACDEIKAECVKCQTPTKNKTLIKYEWCCRACFILMTSSETRVVCMECKEEDHPNFMYGCRLLNVSDRMCRLCHIEHQQKCMECPKDYMCRKCDKVLRIDSKKRHDEHCKSLAQKVAQSKPKVSQSKIGQSKSKIGRIALPAKIRLECWEMENGKSLEGKCWCCSAPLGFQEFEAGHLVAVAKGGKNTLSNLKPVCKTCNNNCRTKNMIDYKKEIIDLRGA